MFKRCFAVQTKNFRRKIHRNKSRLREENGFCVIGWISLLLGLCLPRRQVNGACLIVGKALLFLCCFAD